MAKFELQEMYLTEYNRLIAALQRHFSGVQKYSKIEDVVDYLNSLGLNDAITQIDLNSIAFDDKENATCDYVEGTNTITLIKNDSLTASNIKKGISIEGITGTLVDGSKIINYDKIVEKHESLDDLCTLLPTDVDYYYYHNTDNEIKKVNGTAITNINTVLNVPADVDYNSGTKLFELKDDKQTILYKNFKLQIPISETPTLVDDTWTISKGYVLNSYDLQKISNAEKNALKDNLKYGSTVMGVTGSTFTIIDTVAAGTGDSNHIIADQKYYRNGNQYIGSLLSLATQNLVVYDTVSHENYMSFTPSTEEGVNTYFRIPANTYTHESLYFDITDLKPANIKTGAAILGVEGTANIYEKYAMPSSISIGTTSPLVVDGEETNTLFTKERVLLNDIIFKPVSQDYANDIVYQKSIGGRMGTFSRATSAFSFVEEIKDLTTGAIVIEEKEGADGLSYEASKSNDIALDKYAFINGRLCRGTNPSLASYDAYPGPYEIILGAELPSTIETDHKIAQENFTFTLDSDIIKPDNIKYGVNILGVEGNFTKQDSNPIASQDVLINKIGYVNGETIIGAMPNRGLQSYDSKLSLQVDVAGYYEGITIDPIKFSGKNGTYIYADNESLISSIIRKGWSIDGVAGTGEMIHIASSATEVSGLVNSEEEGDIIKMVASDGAYIDQQLYEIVTSEKGNMPAGVSYPTVDRIFRARELNNATGTADKVLQNYTVFGNRGQSIVGTMTNHGAFTMIIDPTLTYTDDSISVAGGYYAPGNIIIDTVKIDSSKILEGSTILGVEGTYKLNTAPLDVICPNENSVETEEGFRVNTYTPESGIAGYSQVTVTTKIKPKINPITENGIHSILSFTEEGGVYGWDAVEVQVPNPELSTGIFTKNRKYVAADAGLNGWSEITINVPVPTLSTLTITKELVEDNGSTVFKAEEGYGWNEVDVTSYQPGIDTMTATATSDQIVFGATAVVKEEMIMGTMAPIYIGDEGDNAQIITMSSGADGVQLCYDGYTVGASDPCQIHSINILPYYSDTDYSHKTVNCYLKDASGLNQSSGVNVPFKTSGTLTRAVKDQISTTILDQGTERELSNISIIWAGQAYNAPIVCGNYSSSTLIGFLWRNPYEGGAVEMRTLFDGSGVRDTYFQGLTINNPDSLTAIENTYIQWMTDNIISITSITGKHISGPIISTTETWSDLPNTIMYKGTTEVDLTQSGTIETISDLKISIRTSSFNAEATVYTTGHNDIKIDLHMIDSITTLTGSWSCPVNISWTW